MDTNHIQGIELMTIVLAVFVAALTALAKRFHTPYPIVLVLGGLLVSFVPHLPRVTLEPDLVFLVVLPPLVFSAARALSWRAFRKNIVSIAMLAFGLVGFTVAGAAAAAAFAIPGFNWRTGFVLGAIVSPTDPIAATSVFHRLHLPKRIIDLVEAESLVNDGNGLVALQFAVALVVSQESPTFLQGLSRLALLVLAAIPIGLVIGFASAFLLSRIEDASIEIMASLVVPYAAYLSADRLGTSGVLATIAASLVVGHRSSRTFSRDARLTGTAVWDTLTFILNGFVFVLIGLQLPRIVTDAAGAGVGLGAGRLVVAGVLFSVALILLRFVWIFAVRSTASLIRRRVLQRQGDELPSVRATFLVAWSGLRGVLSLAAALSLPTTLRDGSPFPARDAIVFITFCVILVTLVGQGLLLGPLIKMLRLGPDESARDEEERARQSMLEDSIAFLERSRDEDSSDARAMYAELIRKERLDLSLVEAGDAAESGDVGREQHVLQRVRAEKRKTLHRLRDRGELGDAAMRKLERELDLTDAREAL